MKKIQKIWWNVFISWLKYYNIYEPFKTRLYSIDNKSWLTDKHLSLDRYNYLVSGLDYNYILWAFKWGDDKIIFKNKLSTWQEIHNNWENFKNNNRCFVETYEKYNRIFIRELIERKKK